MAGVTGVTWSSLLLVTVLAQTPAADYSSAMPSLTAPEGIMSVVPAWTDSPLASDAQWGFANFWPRIGVQHRTRGYGYNRGYTSLDTFVPLFQDDYFWLTAFQGNVLIDNGGEFGANAGLVNRMYIERWDRIVGVNSFYTHRGEDGSSFNQMGLGVETLGNRLDWRMNGYLPFGKDVFVAEGTRITYAAFSGRDVLVNFLANKALKGFDTEFGGIVPSTFDILRAYAGVYHFVGSNSHSLVGVQARLEARFQNTTTMYCGITNDGTFGTNVVVGASFVFPGIGPRNTSPYGRVADRMSEDVYRNQNITIERGPLKNPIPAKWPDGSRIDVVHVDSAAPAGGDGSLTSPVQTLTQAQGIGVPGSLIFAHANSTFNGEGIVLQTQQQLLGEGVDHTIYSMYGPFTLPKVTPPQNVQSVPVVFNAPGDAVTVANNSVVSGFRILGAAGNGVFGSGVTNVGVDHVDIRFAGSNGINLTNAQGALSLTENFLVNNPGEGIAVSTSSAAASNSIVISDNNILQNDGIGVDVATNGQSRNSLVMERNLVRVNLGPTETRSLPLMLITANDSSQLRARLENNDVQDYYTRDTTSPTEDPYYQQLTVNSMNNSRVDIGFVQNRFVSNRRFLADNPANGSWGFDLNSNDVSVLRARFDTNSSSLNFALSENFASTLQVENSLSTNTGTFYYFPTANFIDVIPIGTLDLP